MNQPAFTFKRGDTFTATVRFRPREGGLANLLGGVATSKIRDAKNSLFDLTCTISEDGLSVLLVGEYAVTKKLSIGIAKFDVRIDIGGTVIHTPTVTFVVEPEITAPEVWIAP